MSKEVYGSLVLDSSKIKLAAEKLYISVNMPRDDLFCLERGSDRWKELELYIDVVELGGAKELAREKYMLIKFFIANTYAKLHNNEAQHWLIKDSIRIYRIFLYTLFLEKRAAVEVKPLYTGKNDAVLMGWRVVEDTYFNSIFSNVLVKPMIKFS